MEANTETAIIQEFHSCKRIAKEKIKTAVHNAILIPLECVFLAALNTAQTASAIKK